MSPLVESVETDVERGHRRLRAWRWMESVGFVEPGPKGIKMAYIKTERPDGSVRFTVLYWRGSTQPTWCEIANERTFAVTWASVIDALVRDQSIPLQVTTWGVDGKDVYENPDIRLVDGMQP